MKILLYLHAMTFILEAPGLSFPAASNKTIVGNATAAAGTKVENRTLLPRFVQHLKIHIRSTVIRIRLRKAYEKSDIIWWY